VLSRFVEAAGAGDAEGMWSLLSPPTRRSGSVPTSRTSHRSTFRLSRTGSGPSPEPRMRSYSRSRP
jgi:hypothetical protein